MIVLVGTASDECPGVLSADSPSVGFDGEHAGNAANAGEATKSGVFGRETLPCSLSIARNRVGRGPVALLSADYDGDGLGDINYRSEKLFANLISEKPELKLFLFSPAAQAIEFTASANQKRLFKWEER